MLSCNLWNSSESIPTSTWNLNGRQNEGVINSFFTQVPPATIECPQAYWKEIRLKYRDLRQPELNNLENTTYKIWPFRKKKTLNIWKQHTGPSEFRLSIKVQRYTAEEQLRTCTCRPFYQSNRRKRRHLCKRLRQDNLIAHQLCRFPNLATQSVVKGTGWIQEEKLTYSTT